MKFILNIIISAVVITLVLCVGCGLVCGLISIFHNTSLYDDIWHTLMGFITVVILITVGWRIADGWGLIKR